MIGAGKDPRNRLRGDELRKYSESPLWDKEKVTLWDKPLKERNQHYVNEVDATEVKK